MLGISFFIVFIFSFVSLESMLPDYGTLGLVNYQTASVLDNIRVGTAAGGRNILYCSYNDSYYWNNIYPAGSGSNHVRGIQCRDMSDLLAGIIGYNYRDSGVSDALQTIQTLNPIVSTYRDYAEDLSYVFDDQALFSVGLIAVSPSLTVVANIGQIIVAAERIATATRIPLRAPNEFLTTSLADVQRVANAASQQIFDAVVGYFNTVTRQQQQIIQVGFANILNAIRPYWDFAHTEYEVLYDVTAGFTRQIPTMTLVSYFDMCDPQDQGNGGHNVGFLGCERFLARNLSGQGNVVSIISYNAHYNSRRRPRHQSQTPQLQIEFR